MSISTSTGSSKTSRWLSLCYGTTTDGSNRCFLCISLAWCTAPSSRCSNFAPLSQTSSPTASRRSLTIACFCTRRLSFPKGRQTGLFLLFFLLLQLLETTCTIVLGCLQKSQKSILQALFIEGTYSVNRLLLLRLGKGFRQVEEATQIQALLLAEALDPLAQISLLLLLTILSRDSVVFLHSCKTALLASGSAIDDAMGSS